MIKTKVVEDATNDLMVDIVEYREKLDTTLQLKYVEEEGNGERDVSLDAGSPIERKTAPVELGAASGVAATRRQGDAALNKTMGISDDGTSEEEEEEEEVE